MTLTKAIEAAREVLSDLEKLGTCWQSQGVMGSQMFIMGTAVASPCRQALAALPDKPMTEDELIKSVNDYFWKNAKEQYSGQKNDRYADYVIFNTVQALKAANVLYVEEK